MMMNILQMKVEFKFKEEVGDKLFIYSYKVNEGGHANMLSRKTNLVSRPPKFEDNTNYYAIPVFCSKNNRDVLEWANDKNWKLFRDYENKEEFIDFLKIKKCWKYVWILYRCIYAIICYMDGR